MENADLDGVLGLGGKCRREAERQSRRGGKPAAADGRGATVPMDVFIAMSFC